MKILICPDVHGRTFWNEAKTLINEVDKVVFLGDYLDPYGHEGITFEDAVNQFQEILDFKDKYPEKVVLLLGNHDMHYVQTKFMNCSRMNAWRRLEMHDIFMNNIDKFQLVYNYEKYLFSHAGVYQEWLDLNDLSLEDLFDFKEFFKNHWEVLQDVSYIRGGWTKVGSCVWADIRECLDNNPVSDFIHIVGHTQLANDTYSNKNIRCLDVRKCFILDTISDEITEP